MLHSIENMRTVAQLCQSRQPLPEALSAWLARSLQSFLDARAESLNDAFGLRNARGGIPWRTEAAIRVRDRALRQLAQTYLADTSVSAQAARIHQLSLRYAASSWRFDCEHGEMPASYKGSAQECLWQAFKSGATMPICARQLRKILGS